jgi:hypothetical protein
MDTISPPIRCAPLLPLPKRAEGTIFTLWEINSLFVGAADDAISDDHVFSAILRDEREDLDLDLRISGHIRPGPSFEGHYHLVLIDNADRHFSGGTIIGTVIGNRGNRIFGLQRR